MPSYFFHVDDGTPCPDRDRAELSDYVAARAEAVRRAGCYLLGASARFWSASDWALTITDEDGTVLFTLHLSLLDGAAARNSRSSSVSA